MSYISKHLHIFLTDTAVSENIGKPLLSFVEPRKAENENGDANGDGKRIDFEQNLQLFWHSRNGIKYRSDEKQYLQNRLQHIRSISEINSERSHETGNSKCEEKERQPYQWKQKHGPTDVAVNENCTEQQKNDPNQPLNKT